MEMQANVKSAIANNIKLYRERIGMTQAQLAQRMGINTSTVSYWETGKNLPGADTLVQICTILQVKPSVLMGVSDEFDDKQIEAEKLMALYNAAPPEVRLAVDSLLKRKE